MSDQNGKNTNIDWEAVYLQLYAYADALLKTKQWFRGEDTSSFLKGKQIHDYVSEAIEKFLTHSEKFDVTTKRSLVNYLKKHIIRTLVGNDAKSQENKTSKDIFAIAEQKEEDDDDSGSYLDSILPYAEALFDQEVDYKEIIIAIEKEVSKDKIVEEVYLGIKCYGLKRERVIKEFEMTKDDFDNGMRRLKTILKNTAKKYDLKKQSV